MGVLILLLGAFSSGPARAAETAPVQTSRTVATLVTDTDSMPTGGRLRVGLRLRLAEGWHTYWKNPGDAGAPPEFTLEVTRGGPQPAAPANSLGLVPPAGSGSPPPENVQRDRPLAPGGGAQDAPNPPLDGVQIGPSTGRPRGDWPRGR